MADWLSYTLADFLLFSPETYQRLFGLANRALWPLQVATLSAGLAIAVLLWRGEAAAGRIVAGLLAVAWLLVAVVWHLERYATINWIAPWFVAGFAVQAAALLWAGAVRGRLRPAKDVDAVRAAGWLILAIALAGYPLLAPLAGRPLAEAQVFAIAPDPTVAATLGALLLVDRPPWSLFALPVAWAVIGGATLWTMESPDALLLPGLAAASLLLAASTRSLRRSSPHDPPL